MNPIAMFLIIAGGLTLFTRSASKRWRLLHMGNITSPRTDHIPQRIRGVLQLAFGQKRLKRYPLAGFAHQAIFFGFLVLLLRSLILFARGFLDDPQFGYWLFNSNTTIGKGYSFIKDIYVMLVIAGTLIFLYYRLILKPKRMSRGFEGILILLIILIMMIADITYDSANQIIIAHRNSAGITDPAFTIWEPLGSVIALFLKSTPESFIHIIWHAGFWTHVGLVFVFLNILPYSKHFHVITAIPNVYLRDLEPMGKLTPIDDIEGKVEREETLGIRRIDQFSQYDILDFYTCTECGRCTDYCPAARTGKMLSPKKIITDLRDHLYNYEAELINFASSNNNNSEESLPAALEDLVPNVINEEMLWACTTCGACEQECPVLIDHMQRIVDLRRYLVQEKGECPTTLQEAFQSMEVTGNPYGVDSSERMEWAGGLDVPVRSEVEGDIELLLWVGCAPATDDRAKKIVRAVAQLLNHAGVKWAVLGEEENCTGDVARRAGNEFLYQTMAQMNIEILDSYQTTKILTVCPHCYNTLNNEYPDFGGNYEVIHHTDYLAQLITQGKLKPTRRVNSTVVYHDSCYLGRYNNIYDSPRDILKSIPGVTVVEPTGNTKDRGMCCGAGGGQSFKESEPGNEHINFARADQLCATSADTIATACPFCMRMMTDALNIKEKTDEYQQLDLAEILLQSVELS